MVDILAVVADKGDFITEIIVRQFGFIDTIAKCYLRQLTEYGCLESHGGNRNRIYRLGNTILSYLFQLFSVDRIQRLTIFVSPNQPAVVAAADAEVGGGAGTWESFI